jgi:hypothetical protein
MIKAEDFVVGVAPGFGENPIMTYDDFGLRPSPSNSELSPTAVEEDVEQTSAWEDEYKVPKGIPRI